METVYAANLITIYGLQLLVALLTLVAGISFAWRWRRDSRKHGERWLGAGVLAGAVAVSFFLLSTILLSYSGGTSTLSGELTSKRVVGNGDNTFYSLDFAAAQQDFVVPRRVYDLVEKGQCLEITYYRDYLRAFSPANLLRDPAFPQQTSAHVAAIARSHESTACR